MPESVFSGDNWDAVALDPGDGTPALVEGVVPLGHDRGVFYYLSRAAGQVMDLTAAQHTRTGLLALASLTHYWQRTRHVRVKGGVNWEEAADDLMSKCRGVGVYDPTRVRGRGAWLDDGRAVLHCGDRLIVDGEALGLVLPGSRFVYEASTSLISGLSEPLSAQQAHQLVALCRELAWESGISGLLLAGWIALGPICGGLLWRPAIWVTGGTGSGKSWLQDNIIRPALGRLALLVQSKTSEAGIRQTLASDARPVLFDEAEADDQAAQARMQGVLDLVRQSSSDSGADIVKGSSDGRAKRYRIRSCWAFFSINAAVLHEADANRITVLALKPPDEQNEDAFRALHARTIETITPEFAAGLVARSVWLLPVIRANAERFARAISIQLGSRRTGDQYGALLAGAYSLHSDQEISDDAAAEFVARQDWAIIRDSEGERDEVRLLSHLTQHRLRLGPTLEPTVGEVIEAALGRVGGLVEPKTAQTELLRIGVKVTLRDEGVWVSNSHPYLRRLMAGTPWAAGWARSLVRLPHTVKSAKTHWFAFGHAANAVWLPVDTLDPPEVA